MTATTRSVKPIASYYSDLTSHYMKYGAGTFGWHYGLWEDGVDTHRQALLQSNHRLVRELELTSATHLLDVGCGVGGFAVWVAKRFGCRVTGISVNPDHLALARKRADRHGVGRLCRFVAMDMSWLGFRSESFDVVVNQETFCYAADKRAYLQQIQRILRPGGVWRAAEFALQEERLSMVEQDWYRTVCEGFHLPSLVSCRGVQAALQELGYEACKAEDVTDAVRPTARYIIRHCYAPLFLCRVGLDWIPFSRDPQRRANHQGHFRAGMAYSRGLLRGCFRNVVYSARSRSAQQVGVR